MGRSNETFSKKEKEKKRLKKQQEKKEKSDARKANSDKGKGLEEMLAYVDENGNISSTPPNLNRQRQINAADIEIGVPRQTDQPDEVKTGIITFFNEGKGFGFIRETGGRENIFFHVSSVSFQARENDKVTFTTERGPRGLNAVNIAKAT